MLCTKTSLGRFQRCGCSHTLPLRDAKAFWRECPVSCNPCTGAWGSFRLSLPSTSRSNSRMVLHRPPSFCLMDWCTQREALKGLSQESQSALISFIHHNSLLDDTTTPSLLWIDLFRIQKQYYFPAAKLNKFIEKYSRKMLGRAVEKSFWGKMWCVYLHVNGCGCIEKQIRGDAAFTNSRIWQTKKLPNLCLFFSWKMAYKDSLQVITVYHDFT